MDWSGLEGWAAPAATIAAALVAGAFAWWSSSNRMSRLRLAVELREHVHSTQQASWDTMIHADMEAVMRQAHRPPVASLLLLWLGWISFAVGTFGTHSALLRSGGGVLALVGAIWFLYWAVTRRQDQRSLTRRLRARLTELEAERDERQAEIERLRAERQSMEQQKSSLESDAQTLLLATGAPMRVVHREMASCLPGLVKATPADPPPT